MKIGVIADDFTGASDIALTLAEAGMSVAQFIGVPSSSADLDLGAGVVALKSRTAPVDDAVAHSLAACDWLLAEGATQIVLKVCSTFDSTARGNIGPVLDALVEKLGAEAVIVCPAFPENGRSVYMGHLFVGGRLLSESGMENHPLTPMTDPDLRRVLGAQTTRDIGHIDAMTVLNGADAIRAELAGNRHLITDAISDRDLFEIGKAADGAKLLCGGSGIAQGLPANFGMAPKVPSWAAVKGQGVVFSGSCSRATREQVARFAAIAPSRQIDADHAVVDGYDLDELVDWVLAQDAPPLIYSSADPETVRATQDKHGTNRAAEAIEGLFARLAPALVAKGVQRVVVAGGETSGAVVTGLDADILTIGPRAAAGVPLVTSNGTALALKSGNFGGPDFFAETLNLMETSA
ncbi:3-oxo-tetronate kinase [Loktanella sp. Alg231-35]|uniref:3-oxo-tetronate kinase n=1 Tax=Loktanella sp. Alg231-35 TaxID=1922220 RepID=UPI000D5544B9|nr:3-oxo-tetronate kinase [Loktanella sp. Alg231-35]